MAELAMHEQPGHGRQVAGLVRGLRVLYALCATLLVIGIGLQVFFAGATMLVNGMYLEMHRIFAHVIEGMILGLVVIGLLARLPWRVQVWGLLAFVLMSLQYVFLYAMPTLGLTTLRGLHAVNALAMFWLALYLTQRTWQLARQTTYAR
jgi:hypothetical protein